MITYSIYTRPINGLCYDFHDLYEVHVLSLLNQSYWRTMRMFSKNNVCEINLFQPFIYRTLKKKLPMRTWKDLIIFNNNYPPKNWNHVSQEKKLPITLCATSRKHFSQMSQLKQLELLFTARHKKLVVGGNQSFHFSYLKLVVWCQTCQFQSIRCTSKSSRSIQSQVYVKLTIYKV